MNIADVTEGRLVERIQNASESYIETLRKEATAAVEDVRQVVCALAEMPARTSDLVVQAAAVMVKEVKIDSSASPCRTTVSVQSTGPVYFNHALGDLPDGMQSGRYRLIVAFVKLDEPGPGRAR